MLIGELINNLAQKAGVVSDSPELKALLSLHWDFSYLDRGGRTKARPVLVVP